MDASENESNSQQQEEENTAPIVSAFNNEDQRCIDEFVERMQMIPPMPTIVLVGDRCSGKSSLVASLIGVKIVHVCTRVPVIIKLRNHQCIELEVCLEYNGTTREVNIADDDPWSVAFAITKATWAIAGKGNEISNKPLTLILKKNGFPSLTIVDLPGMVHDDQTCRDKQIVHDMIMEYITPEDRIILNVIEARIDPFPNVESLKLSKKVDKKNRRTIVVVTKAENVPNRELLNLLILDKVEEMGLVYVCVRNNIGLFESFKESKKAEETLFENHAVLSKINKCMVSIPVLARKLWLIQSKITVTDIMRKINDKSSDANQSRYLVDEGLKEVTRRLLSATRQLQECCSTARIVEMLDEYYAQLHLMNLEKKEFFLKDEIMSNDERIAEKLPTCFLDALQENAKEFVSKIWNNIKKDVIKVLVQQFDSYPGLQDFTTKVVQKLIATKMDESNKWIQETIRMERVANYTCNPCYLTIYRRLLAQEATFIESINNSQRSSMIKLEGIGEVKVWHLRRYNVGVIKQAFESKMKMIAYSKIVLIRHVDFMALHILSTFQNMVNNDIEKYIVSGLRTGYDSSSSSNNNIPSIILQTERVRGLKRE